jgi:6-phosphogluconolactonase (cycloisomerase 2 family)
MPNGVASTPDGRTLLVAELYASRILHFDIRADGSLSEPRRSTAQDHGKRLVAFGGKGMRTAYITQSGASASALIRVHRAEPGLRPPLQRLTDRRIACVRWSRNADAGI